ncbi:hypothetical protein CDAR_62411 [Caerostris darwini]|uniref:Uncharacterized protein n=1 Tax=Caerostris darwini TaxID=1538125 RepID=A0AAV4UFC7_9ARAC|nr:hypothetical protein CDAR_62411 [Caerostris darwini]
MVPVDERLGKHGPLCLCPVSRGKEERSLSLDTPPAFREALQHPLSLLHSTSHKNTHEKEHLSHTPRPTGSVKITTFCKLKSATVQLHFIYFPHECHFSSSIIIHESELRATEVSFMLLVQITPGYQCIENTTYQRALQNGRVSKQKQNSKTSNMGRHATRLPYITERERRRKYTSFFEQSREIDGTEKKNSPFALKRDKGKKSKSAHKGIIHNANSVVRYRLPGVSPDEVALDQPRRGRAPFVALLFLPPFLVSSVIVSDVIIGGIMRPLVSFRKNRISYIEFLDLALLQLLPNLLFPFLFPPFFKDLEYN